MSSVNKKWSLKSNNSATTIIQSDFTMEEAVNENTNVEQFLNVWSNEYY